MFWADKLLKNRKGSELINDAWTPSGIIHMGGLKGPVIHDVISKIIKEQGRIARYIFGFDDMDPIDGLPENLLITHEKYMGMPICNVPGPHGDLSFGEYYSSLMRDLFKKLDIQAEIYLASDCYKQGIYDKAIRFVLDNAGKVKRVYEEIYKKKLPDSWYPLQVVCPFCGRLGTTKVFDWNGQEVLFSCEENLVKWAKGCGKKSKISPFGGNAKMPFKVEWAAKWWTFNVTIEGAGKDHASSGGTYDVARKICQDVFGKEPPLPLAYEFFLYNGKKMSSSKGLGLTARELLEVLPPELARFLMIKTPPSQAIEFNPDGTLIIPRLYDDYCAAAVSQEDYLSRPYKLSQIGKKQVSTKIRFLVLAQQVQMPNMEEEIKKEGAQEWVSYAKVWIEKYAPESEKFLVQKEIPKQVQNLNHAQKRYLKKVAELIEQNLSAEKMQAEIYETAKKIEISSQEAFAAIYIAILGKDHGPKAAWLILSLDQNFVKKRFQEASL